MRPIPSIDRCTTCSTCVTACPVTRVTRRFNGPKQTGPSSQRFRLLNKAEIEALDYCSNCKNCDIACPGGVQISTLNMLARAEQCRHHRPPLRDWILAHGHFLARFASWAPHALLRFGMTNAVSRFVLDILGIDRRAPMPVFAPVSFMKAFSRLEQPAAEKKVVFFPGCYINDYDPQTGLDVVWLLNRAGYKVLVPVSGCCGVPLVANGFFDEARRGAEKIINELKDLTAEGVPVIAACTSCSLMLRQEYGELFAGLEGVSELAAQVHDAGEFIAGCVAGGELVLPRTVHCGSYIYHEPCHLRAQGFGRPALELLRRCGVCVADAGADCCGISGSYGFKKGKYEVGVAVGTPLFEAVRKSLNDGASAALSECGTCRVQIQHHTGAAVRHPLSLLRDLLEVGAGSK